MPAHDPAVPPPGAKRLILTITTGRSGSDLLARSLGLFRDVAARHEPKPRFSSCFRAVCAVPAIAREFWIEEKLTAMHRSRRPIYAETSHFACKGFLESLVDLGYRPDLIHLRRDPRAVALSLWSLRSIPGKSLRGVRYYLSPWDANCLPIRALASRAPSDYQLCYWYCLEIEARARRYRALFAPHGIRVHTIEFDALRTEDGLIELGRALELGELGTLARMRARALREHPINSKAHMKRSDELGLAELDRYEAEVREWIV